MKKSQWTRSGKHGNVQSFKFWTNITTNEGGQEGILSRCKNHLHSGLFWQMCCHKCPKNLKAESLIKCFGGTNSRQIIFLISKKHNSKVLSLYIYASISHQYFGISHLIFWCCISGSQRILKSQRHFLSLEKLQFFQQLCLNVWTPPLSLGDLKVRIV